MKVTSSSLVRTAFVACAIACPVLAAPQGPLGGSQGVGTAGPQPASGASSRQEVQKSLVPLAPPNPIPISGLPITITQSGYYRVTQDLTGVSGDDGISVLASDVVIDLNGFSLLGVSGSLTGIDAFSAERVTVLNGRIASWGVGGLSGISLRLFGLLVQHNQGDGATVIGRTHVQECLFSANSGRGISAQGVLSLLDSILFDNGGDGVLALDADIVDCIANENGDDGLELGNRSRVIRCNLTHNGGSGVEMGTQGLIVDSTASHNSASAFVLGDSSRIERCTADQNGSGIVVGKTSHVVDCTLTSNALRGITGLEGTLVQRCIVSKSDQGILLFQKGCRVSDCRIEYNTTDGLGVSGNSTVERNSVHGNGSRGITAASSGNRIDGNEVADNGVGIAVLAANNLIVRNTLAFNGVQMQIAADNQQGPLIKTKGFIQNTNPWANFDLSFPATFP